MAVCTSFKILVFHIFITSVIMDNISLITWNVRGIMSSALCLSKSLEEIKPDIAIICEHKLSQENMMFLNTICETYTTFPETENFPSRSHVSLLIKKSMMYSISLVSEYSTDRIIVTELLLADMQPVYIIGVYLPYENDIEFYKSYVDHLYDVLDIMSEKGIVILAGDFNAQVHEAPNGKSQKIKCKLLSDFVDSNDLLLINKSEFNTGLNYTFSTRETTIDYIMTHRFNCNMVSSYKTICNSNIELASDHLMLFCTLSIPVVHHPCKPKMSLSAWHKSSPEMLINYQLDVDTYLKALAEVKPTSKHEIEIYLSTIIDVILKSAEINIPVSKFCTYIKPYWSTEVKEAHNLARRKRKLWVAEGRPRGMIHDSYKRYKQAKYNFRKVQEKAVFENEENQYREFNDAAEYDIRLFWKLFKRKQNKKSSVCYILSYNGNTAKDPESITNLFATYFEDLYNCNSNDSDLITHDFDEITTNTDVSIEDLIKATRSLKNRKAPGIDNVQNEHILNGGRTLL